jgi:hypothetical protein
MGDRADVIGTIEHTRRLLGFLETLTDPSPAAQDLIRRYRSEVAAYEFAEHMPARDPEETGSK